MYIIIIGLEGIVAILIQLDLGAMQENFLRSHTFSL